MKKLMYVLEKREGNGWIGHYAELNIYGEIKERPKWKAVLKGNISPKWKEGDWVFILGTIDYSKRPVEVEVELDIKKLYFELVERRKELTGKEVDIDEENLVEKVFHFSGNLARVYKKGDVIALYPDVKGRLLSVLSDEERKEVEGKIVEKVLAKLAQKGYRVAGFPLDGLLGKTGADYVVVFPPDLEADTKNSNGRC